MDLKLVGAVLIIFAGVLALVKALYLKPPSGAVKTYSRSPKREYWESFPMYNIAGIVAFVGLVLIVWK